MRELAYLHQTSLADKTTFQQRVIPVVANEVNIDDSIAISDYAESWIKKAKTLKQKAQDSCDPTMLEEVNLYDSIAKSLFSSLKWSADILLARNWDPNENDQFADLIQLIQQRIRQNQDIVVNHI